MTSLVGVNWLRLPVEMQERAQWCVAGPDKAPYLAGQNGLYHASPVKGPWHTFETACDVARYYGVGIGYIITEDDPYTCIDMDVKDVESIDPATGVQYGREKWTTREELNWYEGIVTACESYGELSASGKGLHVWVRAAIGRGRKGKGVEVYSKERFIVCTGKPVSEVRYHILNGVVIPYLLETKQNPIEYRQEIVDAIAGDLGVTGNFVELDEVDAELTDEEIWARATTAGNAKKFIDLFNGRLDDYYFPSQSEADLALMSMFTFYSKSNEQCRRLFRYSALGKRTKAVKDNRYLDRTLQLVRTRQASEQLTYERGEALASSLLHNMHAKEQQPDTREIDVTPLVARMQSEVAVARSTEPLKEVQLPEVDGLEWPPGLVGAIAGFIYQSAVRPVKEVAIVGALGLMAGIVGKSYIMDQTGLNLYITLVARSAIGKEAMHSGIGHILRSGDGQGGAAAMFVDFSDMVSGPALSKACEKKNSFVSVSGEWGRKLSRLSMEDGRDGPMQQLRTVMTNLYQKSGLGSIVGGMSYSNSDQNVESVAGIAYSMIGETTPGTFYKALTSTMMEDGFLSRFITIEYTGDRPPPNPNPLTTLPPALGQAINTIATNCVRLNQYGKTISIQCDPVAVKMLDDFNIYCDNKIREAGDDESHRQMWNRGHLKASRVAGILATSDNCATPVVNESHARWAIDLIMSDVKQMKSKLTGGDIGQDDDARFKKLVLIVKEYLLNGANMNESYRIDPRMVKDGIVTRKYLQQRTSQLTSFKAHKLGATVALDHVVKSAIDSGYLMEVAKDKAVEAYNFHGRSFRVLDLPK